MENGLENATRLEAVRPGDVLLLQRFRFRVLSAQRDGELVTLELEDAPEHPLTLIGVASMTVTVASGHDSQGLAG